MRAKSPPGRCDELLSRQIHLVSGKGGVGKSAFSCALALRFRAAGHRVLLAQVNAADSHSGLLGLGGVTDDVTEAERGLFVVNTRPAQALREYALMTLKFEALYKAAFENRLTKQFLRFIPSLAELTMLGKLWYHAEERLEGGALRFDRVVIDAPSTGHGLGFLRISQIIRDIVRVGPMYEKTAEMARTFEDPARAALHVVTLPEDMPTNETLEFVAEARRTQVAPLGMIAVNAVPRALLDATLHDAIAALAAREPPPAGTPEAALIDLLTRRSTREALAREQMTRLSDAEPSLPLIELPLLLGPTFGRDEVRRLADALPGTLPDTLRSSGEATA